MLRMIKTYDECRDFAAGFIKVQGQNNLTARWGVSKGKK